MEIKSLRNGTLAIKVLPENLNSCVEFANSGDNRALNNHGEIAVITRNTAFKVHPGEWLLKKGHCLFKLSEYEYRTIYKIVK